MATDGKIKIKVTVDGKELDIVAASFKKTEDSARGAGKGAGEAGQGFEEVGKSGNKADSSMKNLVKSLGLVAIGAAAFKVLKQHLGDAIKRFDALNRMPKVLEALGSTTEEAQRATKKLADGIEGLPTTLDEIAISMQQFFLIFRDADKATKTALALNNALLASGTAGAEAANGAEQYRQALQKGKPDMMEWRSMQTRMSVALNEVADSMGLTIDELEKGVRSGSITMREFNDELIKVGTGTGALVEMAQTMSKGVATSFQNLGTAVTKGLANIMISVDEALVSITGRGLAENLDELKYIVNDAFNFIAKAVGTFVTVLAGLIHTAGNVYSALEPLIDMLGAAAVAIAAFIVLQKIVGWGQMAITAIGSLITAIKGMTVASIAGTGAMATLKAALVALETPAGAITAALALLVGAVYLGIKHVSSATELGAEFAEQAKEMTKDMVGLGQATIESNKGYKAQRTELVASRKEMNNTANSVTGLAKIEKKSASAKKELNEEIEELNRQIPTLGLAYDDQTDKLNMSNAELQARILLYEKEQKLIGSQQHMLDIERQRDEVAQRLTETNAERKRLHQIYNSGQMTYSDYDQALKNLNKTEVGLQYTSRLLADEEKKTAADISGAKLQIAEITDMIWEHEIAGMDRQLRAYNSFTEEQRESLLSMMGSISEYRGHSQNIFDTIEINTKASFENILKTLNDNAEIMRNYWDNLAILMEAGVDEAIIQQLIDAGPKAAGEAAELAKAVALDEKNIQLINDTYDRAGQIPESAIKFGLAKAKLPVTKETVDFVKMMAAKMNLSIDEIDWEWMAAQMPRGLRDGIKGKEAGYFLDEMGELVKAGSRTFEKGAQIESPSRLFRRHGEEIIRGLVNGITDGLRYITGAVTGMGGSAEISMLGLLNRMKNPFGNIGSVFSGYATQITSGLRNGLNANQTAVGTSAGGIFSAISGKFSNALATAKGWGTSITSGVKGGISSGQGDAGGQAGSFASLILAKFANFAAQGLAIGKAIAYGVRDGINKNAASAIGAAHKMANNIPKEVRNLLLIKSPSRIMEKEVGQYIPAGVGVGIEKNAKAIYDRIAKIIGSMQDMFGDAVMTVPELAFVPDVSLPSIKSATGGRGLELAMAGVAASSGGISLAGAGTAAGGYGTSYGETIITGNQFIIREEADISKIAREIEDLRIREGGR